MKKAFTLFVLIVSYCGKAQHTMNCCVPTATEEFAMLASDKSFITSHEDPLPFTFKSAKGHDITYKVSGGTDAHAWEVKTDKNTNYYLFVIHEWWGLNDYIKQESEKLSDEFGANVIALDLYDNKIATTREDAGKYVQTVKTDRALAIIKGAYSYVGADAKVFTIGWCFGGGWSLQTAIEGGQQVVGCIMYYGMPEKDAERLKKLNCDVIGFFANKDQFINPQVVDGFKQNMQKAGKKLITYQYDANHGFANPSNPIYDKTATEDAYTKEVAFIKERMK
ncbi:MAG TPA: dienelactone hydrolase family protein [Chitinophagaceae bacterium]|jgi:carboxymethylenebutenolidase